MRLRRSFALTACALCLAAAPAAAWELGGPLYTSRFPYPPSYYGYNLDETNPGYFGGGRYREYYSYGRGFGLANFPDSLPGHIPPAYLQAYRIGYSPPIVVTAPVLVPVPDGPDVARIDVRVPTDAEVWIEGAATTQTGPERHFVSPPLLRGRRYAYQLRARWTEDGQPVEQTEDLVVRAGDHASARFPVAPEPETLPAPTLAPDGD